MLCYPIHIRLSFKVTSVTGLPSSHLDIVAGSSCSDS